MTRKIFADELLLILDTVAHRLRLILFGKTVISGNAAYSCGN